MSSPDLPLVSIVIPNYNYGRFIAEAIESVLNQTYPNIELIVVDDGSSDDSLEAIRQYEKKLILISQKNSGVVVARNNGAAKSRGEYISFLDADDVIEPTFI